MKILRFQKGNWVSFGVLEERTVKRLSSSPFKNIELSNEEYPLEEIKLLAPAEPSKVVAVGLNYLNHAKELKMRVPQEPILFLKPSTSVIGPEVNILYPAACEQLDYEAELAVVIKNLTKNVTPEEALSHILGFSCGNDVTARNLQKKDGQWTRAKSFDTFSPIGPWIETDLDPNNLKVELLLNGKVRQSSSTSNMIFNVNHLVSFISGVMTLLPGDVIMAGTPPGVGPMGVGDTVEVKIEGIGTLKNYVTAAS